MELLSIKPITIVLWVLAAFVLGIAGSVDSFSSWTLLTGLLVVPPLVMMRRWNNPRPTISESIQ